MFFVRDTTLGGRPKSQENPLITTLHDFILFDGYGFDCIPNFQTDADNSSGSSFPTAKKCVYDEMTWRYGGFPSHGGTPSHHPFS